MLHNEECSTAVNEVFTSVFTKSTAAVTPQRDNRDFFPMESIVVNFAGITKLIEKLQLSSSCGDGEIIAKFLKNTIVYSSVFLSYLFTQSIDCSTLRSDWTVGKVVPLFKSGNTHSPLNYKAISLTSIPCKLLEHVIYSSLVSYLESGDFFTSCQHRFRKNYSCETQLLLFTNHISAALDRGSFLHGVFLDFAKAFDKVPHELLLLKIGTLKTDPNILKWIECFLSNRTQYVIANIYASSPCSVESGVPQGSVLGPLLLLININDLPDNINSSTKLVADDCVIYREINILNDTLVLQSVKYLNSAISG